MKSLVEFIREQCEDCKSSSKSFTFDFSGMENAKESIEALASAAGENISFSADEEKVSFTLTKENFAEATAFITALKDYVKKLGSMTVKRSSDTKFADRVNKMEHKVSDIDSLVQSYSTEETEEKEAQQKGEDEKEEKDEQ